MAFGFVFHAVVQASIITLNVLEVRVRAVQNDGHKQRVFFATLHKVSSGFKTLAESLSLARHRALATRHPTGPALALTHAQWRRAAPCAAAPAYKCKS